MDQPLRGLYNSVGGLKLDDKTVSGLSGTDLVEGLKLSGSFTSLNYVNLPPLPPEPVAGNSAMSLGAGQVRDAHEDFAFSDVDLKYISDMLMEEDMEEKACMFYESSAALQDTEKALYQLIGKTYPPMPNHEQISDLHFNPECPDEHHDSNQNNYATSTSSFGGDSIVERRWTCDPGGDRSSRHSSQTTSQSSHSSGNSAGTVVDSFEDSAVSTPGISEIFSSNDSIMQFKKGFEEASKFIPSGGLLVDLETSSLSIKGLKHYANHGLPKVEEKHEDEYHLDWSRGKKNPHPEELSIEGGWGNKQSAVYRESTLSPADFDMILLSRQSESALREALKDAKSKDLQQQQQQQQQQAQSKGPNGGKSRGRKQGKKNVVDLRTLLTLCAQAVAADDRRSANDYLKQIRQNASPTGDGMQRMAHIFADGLEARLAGAGTQIYKALIAKSTSAADVLKAYHLFLAACPFRKLSNFFSHKTIMNIGEHATTLHVVDFGILYGFQWPSFIQRLSSWPGGPPKLKITGIDLPHPGFRPAVRVEETGCRLANYAKTFNVPFEFHAIAQNWDTIQLEDIKIDRDEVLVVQCLYRLRNLLDETVVVESPRNIVLQLIRKMNPAAFILGIVNGAYSAPFFITRFREALFHYSTLYDVLETNVPREIPERMLLEKEIFGREAMNVIACEGAERIERPETYKQFQARMLRAGFRQLPLSREILTTAKEKTKELYHKDFVVDEDSQWLLQGWKGRILYALSSWKPDR